MNAGFDKPFYSGTNVCEITPQEVAKVITDCVLSNKKVTFHCSDDFLKKFNDDYSIVIDNKVGALTTQNGEKRTTYLKNTGILQFTIYATMKNGGKTLVYNYDMSKNEDIQQYNNILIDLDLEEGDSSLMNRMITNLSNRMILLCRMIRYQLKIRCLRSTYP